MEKQELITKVAQDAGISEDEATKIFDGFIATVKDKLTQGEKVTISGFGTFILSKRKEQTFVNPKTKQVHELPQRFLPRFKAGRGFLK